MTSIEEFFFRYYSNRLLREGYISQKEYQALLTANQLRSDDMEPPRFINSSQRA